MPNNSWSSEAAATVLALTSVQPGPVLISLQEIQEKFGYVPDEAVAMVASACNVSKAEVHGVLTFYHDLRTSPPPPVSVRICVAEACQAVGSRELVSATEKALDRKMGEQGGTVELEPAYCFGNCALGPAAMVNGELVGRLNCDSLVAKVERELAK